MPQHLILALKHINELSSKQAVLQTIKIKHPFSFCTFYSIEDKKFYFLYNIASQKILNPNWRRGLPLYKVQHLDIIQHLKPLEYKKIRKQDFKDLVIKLIKIQNQNLETTICILTKVNIQVIHIKNSNAQIYQFAYQFEKYLYLASALYKKISNQIIQNKFNESIFLNERKKILKKLNTSGWKQHQILECLNLLQQSSHTILSGFSFKLLIYFSKVLGINSAYLALSKNYTSQEKYMVEQKFIKKILILINWLNNKNSHYEEIKNWNMEFPHFNFTCILGNLTKEKIKTLLSTTGDFTHYDLVIYNGHSIVQDDKLHWVCDKNLFQLESNSILYYIHLSCIDFNHNKYDLKHEVPFFESIIPINLLPNNNFYQELYQFFKKLSIKNNFQYAATTFTKNRIFSLCK